MVIEQFGKKMNQDVGFNRKLFWKERSKVNRGKMESCSRMKRWLTLGEDEGYGRSISRIYMM